MDYEQIVYEPTSPVAVIRIHRPHRRNAHTRRLGAEPRDAAHRAAADSEIRRIVLDTSDPSSCDIRFSADTTTFSAARVIHATEAERIGLVIRVVPETRLLSEALSYGRNVATEVSPRWLSMIKGRVCAGLDQSSRNTAREMQASFGTPDFNEGLAHLTENRPPHFTGSCI